MSESSPTPDRETVSAIYEMVKEVPEEQVKLGSQLDTKLINIFGVASIVIGLGGFSIAGTSLGQVGGPEIGLLVLGLLAYATAAYSTLRQVDPRGFHVLKYEELWEYHWNSSALDFQWGTIVRVSELAADNKRILQEKSRGLKLAIRAVAVEVTLIAIVLISILAS